MVGVGQSLAGCLRWQKQTIWKFALFNVGICQRGGQATVPAVQLSSGIIAYLHLCMKHSGDIKWSLCMHVAYGGRDCMGEWVPLLSSPVRCWNHHIFFGTFREKWNSSNSWCFQSLARVPPHPVLLFQWRWHIGMEWCGGWGVGGRWPGITLLIMNDWTNIVACLPSDLRFHYGPSLVQGSVKRSAAQIVADCVQLHACAVFLVFFCLVFQGNSQRKWL